MNEGEQCDDENSSSGDGCSDTCQIEPGYECHLYDEDDGDIEENYSVCSRLCGNGEVDQGEQCDDGNENNSDSCTNSCTVPESSSSSSGDEPQGNGSHRGDRTQDAANEVGYLANYYGFGKTPPPSYGGGEEPPLTPSELSFICSVQRTFRTFTLDIAQSIAVDIAKFLGRDATVLVQMLLDAHTCDGVDSNQGEMSMNLKPFYVDAQGIPVTGDIVLDACLRGGASLKQIRSNIDAMFYRRADVWVPLSCADYHTGDTWHDTKGNYFGFDGPGSRVTPPEGYAVLPLLNVAER